MSGGHGPGEFSERADSSGEDAPRNPHLRHAVHLWADCSRAMCGWAQAYYKAQRERGKSHACAVRCLGHRWLEVLWKMWQTQTRYDGDLHARNQQKHGSWVIKILPPSAIKSV